jgi:hypothetical protein
MTISGLTPIERQQFEARFWPKIKRGSPTECWPWRASIGSHGYGQISFPGAPILAHRAAYELLHGPLTRDIDHRVCRNKSCCNLAHMVPCTRAENLYQPDHPVGQNLLKTHCPQGHPYAGDNLYVTKAGHRQCLACRFIRNRARAKKR